ncbi:MarR family winged helix-turn-helix transcriptional regulator [Streptomyces sp. NPDC020472]|uniref:MarR family winged helix-turn-helix transcriptional regulator n=1 Tax=Streptomyces sp. NPDC020472 TaxID=3365075 RepID=UPI0037A93B5C
MTTTAFTTNGRVIALAHYAARAVLESVLTRHDTTFQQSVTLKSVSLAGGSVTPDHLVADVVHSLKIEESAVREVVDGLTAARLLETDPTDASRLRLTPAGQELLDTTTAETAEITARLYADIPAEDLAVAGRVLALVTERANAELARA